MKNLFYYSIIITIAMWDACSSTMQAQQVISTSVAPFKSYKTLEGSAEVTGLTFRAEGDDLYTEFAVNVEETGEYYLSA